MFLIEFIDVELLFKCFFFFILQIVTTTSTKKNGLLGKENNKDPLKLAMSAKSLELLNRIKMERMKSSQNKVPEKTITKVNANQKNTK